MSVEFWSHVLVLESDLPMLRMLLCSPRVHMPWLSDEQRSMVSRLADAGLAKIEYSRASLSERGYRFSFAHPWYVGGGVAFFWHEDLATASIPARQLRRGLSGER
ncbi:hypothetical protein [Planctomyces sp. SH-PL14]|uniref:hypothetical protein n=1 Tax=Planctomyces sp. SH-PL14 TaxID=1632864 RepID=UPI00078C3CC6|nr:hypothetical protein [Planctomyces sp. SH-PL14]AMV21811.1 hypothetical protein VT03_28170 [Planctomyces sp. SH-PL14]